MPLAPERYAARGMKGTAMDKNLRPYLAELIGTFALVFLGAGTACMYNLAILPGQPQPYVVGVALADGFILAAMLSATVHISGGFLNPAVTLMLWVYKRLDGERFAWLLGAQLLGAVLAGLCIRVLFTENVLTASYMGAPHMTLPAFGLESMEVKPGLLTLLTGIGIEAALTFILTFAIFATLIDPRGPRLGGLMVGLTQAAIVLMAFGLTGGCANPARWFGPWVCEFTVPTLQGRAMFDQVVYWVGPIAGALLAGGVYTTLILPAEEESRAAPAPVTTGVPAGAGSTLYRAKK
jgi:glycerol uptake facilitator-like aquaporin